jgi:hypothetical protein
MTRITARDAALAAVQETYARLRIAYAAARSAKAALEYARLRIAYAAARSAKAALDKANNAASEGNAARNAVLGSDNATPDNLVDSIAHSRATSATLVVARAAYTAAANAYTAASKDNAAAKVNFADADDAYAAAIEAGSTTP